MAKRHKDALGIQQGAVNPSGMAHTLVNACKECIDEGVAQRDDAAVQLIVHQIAYIVGVTTGVEAGNPSRFDYHKATRVCELLHDASPEQFTALKKVYAREWTDKPATFAKFLETCQKEAVGDAIMVPFANMWLGVERDGYTHS